MADDEDESKHQKTKLSPTSASQGDGATAVTYLPRDAASVMPSSDQPVLAEHGGTSVVDAGLGMGPVLPFETLVQGHIGRQLRAVYDEVLQQPIPERFLELLSQLDDASLSDVKGDQ